MTKISKLGLQKKKKSTFILSLCACAFFLFYLWIGALKNPCVEIPVLISSDLSPLILSRIQGKNYFLLADSGGSNSFYLQQSELTQLENSQTRDSVHLIDIKGRHYNWPICQLPQVEVGSLILKNVHTVAETADFYINAGVPESISLPKIQGRVGWPFFKDFYSLIDFSNSSITLGGSLHDIQLSRGIDLRDFVAIPFSIESFGLVIEIETNLGKRRVALDTGSPFSVLRRPKMEQNRIHSTQVHIGGIDFKRWSFGLNQFTEQFAADGILGVDFFLEHSVCLDFNHQIAYIEKPKKTVIGTQLKRLKYRLTQFWVKNFH